MINGILSPKTGGKIHERERVDEVKRPIAVFDSGLGGLTVVRRLVELMPGEDIVYFGDTARVPYGSKSDATILKYSRQNFSFLMEFDPKLFVIGCGTVSSTAGRVLADETDIPIYEMVAPAAKEAARLTKGHIGVIGTAATIRSRRHRQLILEENPSLKVSELACPLFVSLVENGFTSGGDPVAQAAVAHYMKAFSADPPDVLILGCTHYPLLLELIAEFLPNTLLIDPAVPVAREVCEKLTAMGAAEPAVPAGKRRYFASDISGGFEQLARAAMGGEGVVCEGPVDIDSY